MNLILFLYIAAFFSLVLGEFGQFPFGQTSFSVSITDILLILGLSATLIWNIGIKRDLKLPKNFLYLAGFWVVGFFSLLFSFDLSGWLYLFRFILYSSVFYMTFKLIKSGIFGYDEFLKLTIFVSLAIAILGIIQFVLFPDLEALGLEGYDPHKFRLFSTFLDPNFTGSFLSFGLVLITYELMNKKFLNISSFIKENKINLYQVGILLTSIILTFSRSAYLMMFSGLIILFITKSKKLALGLVGVFIILFLVFPQFNERIVGAFRIDDSANERFYSWEKGLIIFRERPIFGVGFNNLRQALQDSNLVKTFSSDGGNSGSGIDSSLIFILATTGLVGFLSFMLFLVKLLIDLIKNLTAGLKTLYSIQLKPVKFLGGLKFPGLVVWHREIHTTKINYLGLPLFAILTGLLLNSFFINSLFYPQIMFLLFSIIGIYYGLGEGDDS